MTITNYDSSDLVNYNKQYIPDEYYDEDYIYTFNGNDIVIITDNNCRTQYNSTYCTCYTYNTINNIISEGYECNTTTNNTRKINQDYISTDIYYSNRSMNVFYNEKIIGLGMLILAIIFATFLLRERKCL